MPTDEKLLLAVWVEYLKTLRESQRAEADRAERAGETQVAALIVHYAAAVIRLALRKGGVVSINGVGCFYLGKRSGGGRWWRGRWLVQKPANVPRFRGSRRLLGLRYVVGGGGG